MATERVAVAASKPRASEDAAALIAMVVRKRQVLSFPLNNLVQIKGKGPSE
jgi:hypothetical protein